MNTPTITSVNPTELQHLASKNPNVMDPHEFEALKTGIEKHGFLQPVLVLEEEGVYTLVDGVHRSKAAAELGLDTIPAVVAPDRAAAEMLRIAMNKLRGQLDLTEVGRQLAQMLDDGVPMADLTMTGFPEWDVQAMIDLTGVDVEEEDLGGADVAPPEPKAPKSFNLTLKFDTESERAKVREFFEDYGDGDFISGLKFVMEHYGRA